MKTTKTANEKKVFEARFRLWMVNQLLAEARALVADIPEEEYRQLCAVYDHHE